MALLAKMKSGHDKNHIYLIVKEDEKYVYLANGTTKKLTTPKKKNPIHIQRIKKLPARVLDILNNSEMLSDELIHKVLEEYKIYLNNH